MDSQTDDLKNELSKLVTEFEEQLSELHDLQRAMHELGSVLEDSDKLTQARSTLDSMTE